MKTSLLSRYVIVLMTLLASATALASDVQIIQMKGSVTLRSRGQVIGAKLDASLAAPLEVRTGADGMVTLRQLGSELNVGPNSVVLMPEVPAQRGATQRIEQSSGRVLYSVDRKDRDFVVETRHLVSVVKGTVFSIAAEAGGTQVSLLEGSLQVNEPGLEEQGVLLKPNESATRSEGGAGIRVEAAAFFAPPAPAGTTAAATTLGSIASSGAALAATGNVDRVQLDLADLVASISDQRSAPPVIMPQPQDPKPPKDEESDSQPLPDPLPDPAPDPAPDPVPDPAPDDGQDDDDDHCFLWLCHDHGDDDDDDDNSGHGDDDDDDDDDNPGRGRGR